MNLVQSMGKKMIATVLAVVLLLGSIGYQSYEHLLRTDFVRYESLADNFKYGSIGNEQAAIPYWIWLVLPRIFSDILPNAGGYTALGFTWEPGQEVPVGISKQTIGYPRISLNCAVCHSGTYRSTATAPPVILPAAPSSKFNYDRYRQFLGKAAADNRFTADYLMEEIEYTHHFSFVEGLIYRYWIIPQTKQSLLTQAQKWDSSMEIKPLWQQENINYHQDKIPITNQVPANLPRIVEYLRQAQPPVYPFEIDQPLAAKGSPIFQANCAACHTKELDSLAGIWSSAPYLHNGSVPTLTDLLNKSVDRPTTFYRGFDVYDPVKGGFVATGAAAAKKGFKYEVVQGNNHNYGTSLPTDQKKALVEYLKTF
jgi:hypothetical protein